MSDQPSPLTQILARWSKQREEEAATMCAKRTPTEEEIDRAMVIGKWFFGWTDKTGPCPIGCMDEYWHKKLCALFEWIAVLETEATASIPHPPHACECGYTGEPDSREVRNIKECGSEMYCPKCGKVFSRASA